MVRSLYSGVSGLTTHQTRMDVIGNNIANVNTYGYKAQRTTFRDIYYQTSIGESSGSASFAGNNPSQVGYGVQLGSIDKDMSQSSFQNTNRTLDVALTSDGFFITAAFPEINRTLPVDIAEDGTKVYPENPAQLTAEAGAQIKPLSVKYTRMGNFGIDSYGNLVTGSGNEFVLGTCGSGGPGEGDAAGTGALGLTGNASKKALQEMTARTSKTVLADGATADTDVTSEDLTANNIINITELINQAWPQGEGNAPLTYKDLQSFSIGADGMICVMYNEEMKYIARLDIAVFDNPEGLGEAGNTSYERTSASGEASIKRPKVDAGVEKTETKSNALEMSNVNLANEFSDMIVTQRGFQANARIITTSDSMLEELVNLKR